MKVAKLVRASFTRRVIVNKNATEEEIIEATKQILIDTIKNELSEHIEEIVDDKEVPYNPEYDKETS